MLSPSVTGFVRFSLGLAGYIILGALPVDSLPSSRRDLQVQRSVYETPNCTMRHPIQGEDLCLIWERWETIPGSDWELRPTLPVRPVSCWMGDQCSRPGRMTARGNEL